MHKFKVYPGREVFHEHEHLYWDIEIIETYGWFIRKMNRFIINPAHSPLEKEDDEVFKTRAFVNPFIIWSAKKGNFPVLGIAFFCGQHINAEIVTHESVHMATSFLRRIRKSLKLTSEIDFREECLAYAVGQCTKQIAQYLYDHKLW